MIGLIHERLALAMSDQASLRLLEPPMSLQPINQLMLWATRAEADPGHRWLRGRVLALAQELQQATPVRPPASGRDGRTRDKRHAGPARRRRPGGASDPRPHREPVVDATPGG